MEYSCVYTYTIHEPIGDQTLFSWETPKLYKYIFLSYFKIYLYWHMSGIFMVTLDDLCIYLGPLVTKNK